MREIERGRKEERKENKRVGEQMSKKEAIERK